MIVFLPVLVCIIGALVYALAGNPKAAEMGRIAFFCGLFAFVVVGAGQMVSLLGQ